MTKDEALKLALEALERLWNDGFEGYPAASHESAITAIKEALAEQSAQQPYGWKVYGVNSLFTGKFAEDDAKAEAKRIGGTCVAFPIYTSPSASKPWVGLTETERKKIYRMAVYVDGAIRMTEAKLKEKNNG